jgi:UTP--glucose-1-phosphate uridylyltransferase
MGRYILTPRLFEHLQHVGFGAIGEIQITDGIKKLMQDEPVHGYVFKGTRYDCGSKLGFLQAAVAYARKHSEIGEEFNKYLKEII